MLTDITFLIDKIKCLEHNIEQLGTNSSLDHCVKEIKTLINNIYNRINMNESNGNNSKSYMIYSKKEHIFLDKDDYLISGNGDIYFKELDNTIKLVSNYFVNSELFTVCYIYNIIMNNNEFLKDYDLFDTDKYIINGFVYSTHNSNYKKHITKYYNINDIVYNNNILLIKSTEQ